MEKLLGQPDTLEPIKSKTFSQHGLIWKTSRPTRQAWANKIKNIFQTWAYMEKLLGQPDMREPIKSKTFCPFILLSIYSLIKIRVQYTWQFFASRQRQHDNLIEHQGQEKYDIFWLRCLNIIATPNIDISITQPCFSLKNMVTFLRQYCRMPSSD